MLKMPLFGSRHKSPHDLVRSISDNLSYLAESVDSKDEASQKKIAKVSEEASRAIASLKGILVGSGDQESQIEIANQAAQEIHATKLLNVFIDNMTKVDFEGRKDIVVIFSNLLRRQMAGNYPTVNHIVQHQSILDSLMTGYKNQEIALSCGTILRDCFKHEELVRIILYSPHFYVFFSYVEVSTFDISSDAFLTFKELLTRHKVLSSKFLDDNFDDFFAKYHQLLASDNYVTRRQALKLLGELLLDRYNFNVMNRYIGSADNLIKIMDMLKEQSRNIQFEAFHVFKVFVANPDKSRPIQEILLRRRDKLIEFLSKFHADRSEDEQFNDEKAYLIKQIKDLKPLDDLPPPITTAPPPPLVQPAPAQS